MEKVNRMQRNGRIWSIICIVLILSLFIPTPYYILQPGSVEELEPKVTVIGGNKIAEGNLYLTTVFSLQASNIYYLAYGYFAPHTQLRKVEDVRGDLTDKEYSLLLDHMMTISQQNALVAGLRAAGEEVMVEPTGIFVRSIVDTSHAAGVINVGDTITKVDGQPLLETAEFLSYLADKMPGDIVNITYVSEGQENSVDIPLIELDNSVNDAGVGMVLEDQFQIQTDRTVNINAEDIGGPSAGLMFSLEIYNQLADDDITKGYEIAGTGTIDHDGNVGQIGGITEKITSVERADIDIFFCPADIHEYDANEKDVMEKAEKEGYDVKIVPVKTLQEAIDYLEKLPPKL